MSDRPSTCVQNDRYTVGGAEMFDTLTDLVEFYKRKGIEEISGNWVYFKQVRVPDLTEDIMVLFLRAAKNQTTTT